MDNLETSDFDDPGYVARHSVLRAIDMDDEQAGITELRRLIAEGLDVAALGGDEDGRSVFFWAAKRGRTALAAALIDAGAILKPEVAATGHEGSSLHMAAEVGNIEIARLLLAAGGKPLLAKFDHVDRTPLHIAAERADFPMVKLLISAGADVNAHNEANIGFTPLDAAVESGSVEVVRWLPGAGANPPEETRRGRTPLAR